MSKVIGKNGSEKVVKNGWLLRNASAIIRFEAKRTDGGAPKGTSGLLIAHLDGDRRYETEYASFGILLEWLKRPLFYGKPITINDSLETSIGEAAYEMQCLNPYVKL